MGDPDLAGAFELRHNLPGASALEPFIGKRGTGEVAAQAFELPTRMARQSAAALHSLRHRSRRLDSSRPPCAHALQRANLRGLARRSRS